MSLKTLINEIVAQVPDGYNRTGTSRSILKLIDDGQRDLFDYDAGCMIYIGEENEGMPPYLTTVSGTYRYEITAANLTSISAIQRTLGGSARDVRAKRVLSVFMDCTQLDYGRRWMGRERLYHRYNPLTTAVDKLQIVDIPVQTFPALGEDAAWVVFPEDPGTGTDKYYVEFIWEPAPLTAETTPLSVPQRYERALEDYAVGTVQMRATGKVSERLDRYHSFWVPEFRTEMGSTTSLRPKETPTRYC